MNDWEFKCIVKGTGPDDESNIVKVNVSKPVTFDDIDDLILCNGTGAIFAIENLEGTAPFNYSWKRGTTEISKNAQLNLNAIAATDGVYSIEINNNVCPSVKKQFEISHYANLDVDVWANINETCVGDSPKLDVKVNNSAGDLKYTWTKDDGLTVLSTVDEYTLPGLSSSETGTYKVKVEDKCMSKTISGFVNVYTPVSKINNWDGLSKQYCIGEELVLEVSVDGDFPTYSWNVPNALRIAGSGSKIKFDNLSKDDQGTYTCKVTDKCGKELIYTIDITILDSPVIDNGIENLIAVCEGDPLELGPISVIGSYDEIKWTLNDNTENTTSGLTLNRGVATPLMEGNYKVSVSNICGTDESVGKQVVNPKTTAEPMLDQTVCEGDDVIFRVKANGRKLKYKWKIDGIDKSPTISTLLINGMDVLPADQFTPKTYKIECIVSNDNGCGDNLVVSAELTVNPATILLKTLKNETAFVGSNHTLSVESTGHNLSYTWTHVNDGITTTLAETGSTITLNNVKMTDAGYYNCLISSSCGARLASGKLTVKEPVVVHEHLASLEKKCVGDPLNLSINATGQISNIKWTKDGIDLPYTELNLYIPELKSTDAGVYVCTITGDGTPSGGLVEEVTVRVYENTKLNALLGTKKTCEGDELEWIPNLTGAPDLDYQWIFGGIVISSDKILHYDITNLTHKGEYELKVTGLCGDVATKGTLEVMQKPAIVTTSENKEACENTPLVEFNVTATGDKLKYQWKKNGVDMPGKTSPVLSLTSIQLEDEATYTCEVSNSCDKETSNEMMLKVIPQLQIVSEIADFEVCAGEEVSFVAEVNGNDVTYQWKLDGVDLDGENASVLNLGKTSPDDSGYYTCIVSDKCTDSRSTKPTELTVHELPNSRILGRMVLCAKEDRVTYTTDDLPEIEYGWGVEGGVFAGPQAGLRTRVTWGDLNNGELSIMITDAATGCESKLDSTVTLNALPTVNLTAFESKGVCNESFTLSGGFPEGGIYWVNDISEEDFDPADKGPGTYNIHYSYTDKNGCSNVSEKTILKVDALPTVNITDDTRIGSCKPFVLNAETEEDNIQWSPATNLDDPNSMTPTFTPGKSQVLIATVMDEHGCTNMDLVELTVAPLPTVTTISDTTVGQCNQLQLLTDIVGDAGEITWTNPDHLDDPNTRSPKIVNAPGGTYTYKINVTDLYGCNTGAEVVVNVVADPVLSEDVFACEGEKFEVNIAGMDNPKWKDGYTEELRTITQPGKYLLSVDNKYGCGDEQNFVINPTPKLELINNLIFDGPEKLEILENKPVTILEGQTVTIAPNLPLEYSPYFFEWQDGSILQRYEASETGIYKLIVRDHLGCVAVDSVDIEVKPVGIESPNAFTPNSNDTKNNKFYLKRINYDFNKFEMYVYNRWGELLYKTNEPDESGGWNGKYKGKLCPAGAYVWMVFIDGKLTNKGTFMLIR